MKKCYLMIISLVLVAVLSMTAFATGTYTATAVIDNQTLYRTSTFTITVSVDSVVGRSGGFTVVYNDALLEMTAESKFLLEDVLLSEIDLATKDGVFQLNAEREIKGAIAQLTFKVREDAQFLETEVKTVVTIGGVDAEASVPIKIKCVNNFTPWTKVDDKQHTRQCSICREVETTDHTFDTGKVTKPATCLETGEKVYTCTGCGHTKTETLPIGKHNFVNACDTDCNVCGTTREITHDFRKSWVNDKNCHAHECAVCGFWGNAEAHKPGPAPTETTAQTCTECGYILKAALGHTHAYATEWSQNEQGHWHACQGCEVQEEFTQHVFEHACDTTCDVCGFSRETEHMYYENYLHSAEGHWHECRVCGEKLEMEHHEPNDDGMCTACGYQDDTASHEHKYQGDWKWDATGHWKACECGEKNTVEPHVWNEGTVTLRPSEGKDGARLHTCNICGAEKTELIPAGTIIMNNFPWMLVIIIGGIVIIGITAYILVGVLKSRKKTGRFS